MKIDPRLQTIVAAQPYPLLFATISGAHLYGFPSPDSDYDLRGAHMLPLELVLGLDAKHETVEASRVVEGLEMDIVSHDVRKFFGLLLKKNGYVLEQLFSPLVVYTTPEHEELISITRRSSDGSGVITKHHAHHYLGFAETQWKLFHKESPRRVKPLLYVYRVLLTGIHLMRTGELARNTYRCGRPCPFHIACGRDFKGEHGRIVALFLERGGREFALEELALRQQQIMVLQRTRPRPTLNHDKQLFWVFFPRIWSGGKRRPGHPDRRGIVLGFILQRLGRMGRRPGSPSYCQCE